MRLSREARILLAIVAVAAAAWIWINFYNQAEPQVADAAPGGEVQLAEPAVPSAEPDVATTPEAETPETGAEAGEAEAAPATDVEAAEPGAEAPGDEAASGDLTAEPPTSTDGTDESPEAADPGAPGEAVAAEPLPAVAGRNVEVVELPFLITAPPPQDTQDDLAAAAELELSRPASDLRVTVNPFSPILLAPAPVEASAPSPASGSNQNGTITEVAVPGGPAGASPGGTITEVPIPGAPANTQAGISPGTITAVPIPDGPSSVQTSAAPGTVSEVAVPGGPSSTPGAAVSEVAVPGAPTSSAAEVAPQASAPTPEVNVPIDPLASNLPRTLPSGTFASTPEILRPSRNPALPGSAGQPGNLSQVTALSVPNSDAAPALPLEGAPIPAAPAPTEAEVAPLGVGAPADAASAGPMAAGVTQLSRYLRDQNYRFTGSVIGPVGVGVFRMGDTLTPVVVPLGQTLPETDIVLTSLQGKQAELTRENDTQVLVLDLR